MSADPSPEDHVLELARRVLAGEAIDWEKEQVAESEVREGMKRLQKVMGQPTATESAGVEPPQDGDHFVGEFRLVRKLGEGGMGVVYEAEQQHPRRPVALKVIRGGRHVDAHTLRLFQREIHTLARLGHPGIAQLYEAGVTDEGMHFFAMELVRGVSLSEWLQKRGDEPVTPAEMRIRLGVFRKICDAVAFAHQKGVIHRDLKPANILIPTAKAGSSVPDAVPEVKILDFGLARMTDTDVQMTTFHTDMGRIQGTLPYMSPEQIRGNPDEIDLRTDVYSLGVILYELVTGKLPLDVSKAQLPEAMRIICEEVPRSISTTFAGTKRLDADIATIAGKCLEKETARRYQSAAALAEDVQRYLSDQPIQARPPSAAYQFRKLVLRHKLPFAFAGAVFVLLTVFAGVMTVQAARIARERDRANLERDRANREAGTAKTTSDFLVNLFQVADPGKTLGRTITAKEILDQGAKRIEHDLVAAPLTQAQLMTTLGQVYQNLGAYDQAEPLVLKALDIKKRELGDEHPEVARSMNALGFLYIYEGRGTEARPLLERSLSMLERSSLADPIDIAWGRYFLALAEGGPRAVQLLHQALDTFERVEGSDSLAVSWCLNDLGNQSYGLGDLEGALRFFQRALSIKERRLDPMHPDVGVALFNVGRTLMELKRYSEAEPYIVRFRALHEQVLDPMHPFNGDSLHLLGELYRRTGDLDRARPLLERALAVLEKVGSSDPADISLAFLSLADLHREAGRHKLAEDFYRRALAQEEKRLPATHPAIALTLRGYAALLKIMHRADEARALEARAKGIDGKQIGPDAEPDE